MTSNQVSLMRAMHLPSGNIHSGDGLKRLDFRMNFEKDLVLYLNELDK